MDLVYLDHAAQTTCEPAAREALAEILADYVGTPDSPHRAGRRLRARIERARGEVADYLGCGQSELQFHHSGSAALSYAIERVASSTTGTIVTSAIEHSAVRSALQRHAERVELLNDGADTASVLSRAEVVVLSPLNHELGTFSDLGALMAAAPRATFVVDAVQAAAWLDLESYFRERVFVAVAAQKLGGPPGVAALRTPPAFAQGAPETPDATNNAAGIVAFGAACRARAGGRPAALTRISELGHRLLTGLTAARPGAAQNGRSPWLGTILNIAWPDLAGHEVEHIMDLEGVAIGRMSACRRRYDDVSSVVTAAYPEEYWRARGATRWSLGWTTTPLEIEAAISRFTARFGNA